MIYNHNSHLIQREKIKKDNILVLKAPTVHQFLLMPLHLWTGSQIKMRREMGVVLNKWKMEFFLQCLKKQFFHLLLKCHAKLRFLTIAQRKHMYILEPKIAPPYSSLHITCILCGSTSTPGFPKLHFPYLQVASKREK